MAFANAILETTGAPTMGGLVLEIIMFLGPVWIAFFLGIMLGWAWKPKWASLGNCKFDFSAPSSRSTSVNPSQVVGFGGAGTPNFGTSHTDNLMEKERITLPQTDNSISSSSQVKSGDSLAVKEDDLEHLCRLVERKDGGQPWKHMMERTTSDMSCQAWQRDPGTGPPQYCSRTVYENATPELLRDFFWDDEFRLRWDDMLIHAESVEECPTTGTMIVHWIRKFPFFCSDREYIIGRRIWESGRSYYCVTKGVPFDSIPRRDRPRRVDLYYSSWFIQAVESRKENGRLNACEVILFHHEDMGIPWEIAKFGVRQGMWGTVRKIERGFRAYQKTRASGKPISHPAFMAQINSKIDPDYLKSLEGGEVSSETEVVSSPEKPRGMNIPKLLVIGGAVVVACSVDQGLLTKTVIFSIARTFANIGRRAYPGR